MVLGMLREARSKGLTAPVVLMGESQQNYILPSERIADGVKYISGYYNPMLAYGEDKAIQDASEAGANGFIMVDLPPEEAITFREKCLKVG